MKAERKPRAYKITDKSYNKAMKKAKKEKKSLATLIEEWVTMYADGTTIVHFDPDIEEGKQSNKK